MLRVDSSPEQKFFLYRKFLNGRTPQDKLVYFRDRLRDRLHATILDAFLARSEGRGFKQKHLAIRIHRAEAQITRWFSTASNLTLDSISDLMVVLAMDFDAFPFTHIEETQDKAAPAIDKAEKEAHAVGRLRRF